MPISLSAADWALIIGISMQGTLLARIADPRWKAAVFSLPIPFTLTTLSLGQPVAAAHVLGLVVLYLYAQVVRVLHARLRVPIVPAIAVGLGTYIGLGSALAPVVPLTDAAFWTACAGTFALGGLLWWAMPRRDEPAYRSPLPTWLKLPVILVVVCGLVLLKQTLQGFMALFPLMGTLGAYEARHSLWTLTRQIPLVMITFMPMMAAMRLVQDRLGLGGALVVAWLVFFAVFVPLTRVDWRCEPADRA